MAPGNGDERRSPRSKVLLSGALEWPGGSLPVVLRDLSEHGALVESSGILPLDTEVVFCRNDLRVRGNVAWARDRFAGISFDRALNPEVVLRHIPRPVKREADPSIHRRPAVAGSGMSAEEQRWFKELTRAPARRNDRT
jgi:PilZ domain